MKHLVSLLDFTQVEVRSILETALSIKRSEHPLASEFPLQGQLLVQIYEKPSLRTRVSFEAAMVQLGGSGIFMTEKSAGFHGRESLEDIARVVSGYAKVIVLRTFSHKLVEDFAAASSVPVINGLTDERHPCQALTDLMTMYEAFGSLEGRKLVYVGDGNNVAISLATICAMLDVSFELAGPESHFLPTEIINELEQAFPHADLKQTTEAAVAVKDCDVIYTDVWASMGQEEESRERQRIFAPYQVNQQLMAAAPASAKFMHCLPAKRGQEVTNEVMESDQSIVFQQAENRMHLAKGLFVHLLVDGQ